MKYKYWLLLIFLLVVSLRLLVVFQTSHFDYDTYDTIRQVESILEDGKPLFYDELSHGGRDRIFSPVYYYILAFFALFIPLGIVINVIPNIIGALIVIITYNLVFLITRKEKYGLIFAVLSSMIPVYFFGTVNNASILNLAVPLFLLTIYYFIQSSRDSKYVIRLIASLIFLTVLHPSSIILAVSLLIYLIVLKLQNFRESIREPEVVLFFSFFVFWVNMLLYKRVLISQGNLFIWQNLPTDILSSGYIQINFLLTMYSIGSVLLIFGLASVYYTLFVQRKKSVSLLMTVAIIYFAFLFLSFVEYFTGLIFLGAIICVLGSYAFSRYYEVLENFKSKIALSIFISIIFVVQLLLFIPSIGIALSADNSPTDLDVNTMRFMSGLDDAKILSQPFEGSALSYYSSQKNVIDNDYLLVTNVDRFYSDARSVYSDKFLTNALGKLTAFDATHIFLSERYQLNNNVSGLSYADNECVVRIYPDISVDYDYHPKVYEVRCELGN